jgi:hypothetical protein
MMKKIIHKIVFILAAVGLFVSCEPEYIMFDSSKNFVAFPEKTTSIAENGGMVGIPVYVVALPGSPAVTVTFDFDNSGLNGILAEEGSDYTLVNNSKTLNFPDGWGYDTIWIQPVDNDVFTGNKVFNVVLQANSQNYPLGVTSSNMVTLVDNEHPLKQWIGTYSVEALSYGSPGEWDEAWTVNTSPVPDDIASLSVVINTGGSDGDPFLAAIDVEAMTITIPAGTDVGNVYGYGPTTIWVGDYETLDRQSSIIGTIEEDGTIKIDKLALLLTDYGDYYWDAFNTTWTKIGKKAAAGGKVHPEKAARLK